MKGLASAGKEEGRSAYAVGDHLDSDERSVGEVHVERSHINVRARRSVRALPQIVSTHPRTW